MTVARAARGLRITLWPAIALLAGLLGCGAPADDPATLAFIETRVWTGNPEQPWAEAVAVRGDRIVAVGTSEEIAPLIDGETRVLTMPDGMLVPGFIDSHVHFVDGGAALASVQLRDAATPEEFVDRIAAFAADLEPGEWILGGTWDHENWGGELPQRSWIDDATPDNPVWIMRLDGHMGLANTLALELAGVGADTADVDGGEIVRGADGELTGVLKDNAMVLITEAVPPAGDALRATQVRAAMRHVASLGVTTVHDMAQSSAAAWANIATYRELHGRGELITRIHPHPPITDWQRLTDEIEARGRGDDWLRLGGLKAFMDGSLGSHTAAFFEPFTDAPDDRGLLLNDADDMRRWIRNADAAGLQLAIHAIGDRAISNLLDMYLETVDKNGARDRRFRIEHAQHIHPSDLSRFAEQDVIASMQPYHAIDDGRWAEKVIGAERAKTTYAFRSLLDSEARVAFGSDWYVAPADPLAGIFAAVTRRTLDGANPDGWVPEQKITVEEALRAYTVEAAYASFDEDTKGMIRPGMLADLVLIDRDLTSIAPEDIRDANVLLTIVGGDVVFDSSATASNYALENGRWYDGDTFVAKTMYSVDGLFADDEPVRVDGTIDLDGAWIVPPFGDAHNHTLEMPYNVESFGDELVSHGIFYVKNPNSIPRFSAQISDRVARPDTVDATFSGGGLTGRDGHPSRIYNEVLAKGPYSWMNIENFEDLAYFVIDDEATLDSRWSDILAGGPDFIKTYLLYSEDYALRRDDEEFYGFKGLDPALLPAIVAKAHASGLRVSVHVNTAADFRNAVAAGVDEINHLPGRPSSFDAETSHFFLDEADVALAAEKEITVVPTYSLTESRQEYDADYIETIREIQRQNLELLKKHGVAIAMGPDSYNETSRLEAFYLRDLGVFSNAELLEMWSVHTPRTIFPERRIGSLERGYEASFIALAGNPLEDFDATRDIVLRFKQGEPLLTAPSE